METLDFLLQIFNAEEFTDDWPIDEFAEKERPTRAAVERLFPWLPSSPEASAVVAAAK